MIFSLNWKTATVAYLFSSHASTAKSFVPYPPMHYTNGIQDPHALKRPYQNALLELEKRPVISSRLSRTSAKIQSLRGGGSLSMVTIFTSSLNAFFKQNPYAAAFLICELSSAD